jgi:signal peptidase II
MYWALAVVVLVLVDQITKYIIVAKLQLGETIEVIDKFFFITFWKNNGAAWGILQGNRIFLITVTIIALGLMTYLFLKSFDKLARFSIVLIIAGALGNFTDRLLKNGEVTDFLLFTFGSYKFPVFNVADILIVIGTGLFIITMLTVPKSVKKNEKSEGMEKCC